ncbi:hypothetical protein [Roseiconus lacunae]|uniref:hypothetical protein n=1 Tax=Roseiconus lacunae TaxID=2605694 RepID=UPI001E64F7A3|nr:hypothetical protein [Roseiconus lacunae]MCD0461005.1 hypothetical protein [Roseiconus lacunae]
MRQLFPAMTAVAVVALVASVGYAEVVQADKAEETLAITETPSTPTEDTETPGTGNEVKANLDEEKETARKSGVNDSQDESDGKHSSSSPLSVAPMTHVTYPDDWPQWADAEPSLSGSVHTWPVSTGGCKSIEQCEEKLVALLRANVALYIKESTGWISDGSFLSDQWIDDELIVRRYVGKIVKGDEELHEIAVELEFDSEVRAKIKRAMNNDQLEDRLRASSGLFVIALIGLCCSGGLLGVISRRFA